jgi:hypothetical protein
MPTIRESLKIYSHEQKLFNYSRLLHMVLCLLFRVSVHRIQPTGHAGEGIRPQIE